jgi:hypothetical protein
MITSKKCDACINISTTEGRDRLRDIIGVVNNYVSDSTPGSDRNLLDRFATVYPDGVDIVAQNNGNEVSLHINGKALSAFGTFSGASATGIMLDLLTLLAYVTDVGIEDQSGLDSKIYSMTAKVSRGMRSWCDTMVKSKGIMKSMARAGDVVVGKVKTSYSPLLHSSDGVPVSHTIRSTLSYGTPLTKVMLMVTSVAALMLTSMASMLRVLPLSMLVSWAWAATSTATKQMTCRSSPS